MKQYSEDLKNIRISYGEIDELVNNKDNGNVFFTQRSFFIDYEKGVISYRKNLGLLHSDSVLMKEMNVDLYEYEYEKENYRSGYGRNYIKEYDRGFFTQNKNIIKLGNNSVIGEVYKKLPKNKEDIFLSEYNLFLNSYKQLMERKINAANVLLNKINDDIFDEKNKIKSDMMYSGLSKIKKFYFKFLEKKKNQLIENVLNNKNKNIEGLYKKKIEVLIIKQELISNNMNVYVNVNNKEDLIDSIKEFVLCMEDVTSIIHTSSGVFRSNEKFFSLLKIFQEFINLYDEYQENSLSNKNNFKNNDDVKKLLEKEFSDYIDKNHEFLKEINVKEREMLFSRNMRHTFSKIPESKDFYKKQLSKLGINISDNYYVINGRDFKDNVMCLTIKINPSEIYFKMEDKNKIEMIKHIQDVGIFLKEILNKMLGMSMNQNEISKFKVEKNYNHYIAYMNQNMGYKHFSDIIEAVSYSEINQELNILVKKNVINEVKNFVEHCLNTCLEKYKDNIYEEYDNTVRIKKKKNKSMCDTDDSEEEIYIGSKKTKALLIDNTLVEIRELLLNIKLKNQSNIVKDVNKIDVESLDSGVNPVKKVITRKKI